jgi:hypothetical protein
MAGDLELAIDEEPAASRHTFAFGKPREHREEAV